VIASRRPEWVVHCAALTDVDACEGDPEAAFRLNRDMARTVAEAAWDSGAGLVHISTDAVFDGEGGPYREEDEPKPVNVYGRSKLEGEQAAAAAHARALIVRTNFYGWNAQPKHSLAEWFLERLGRGEETPGFVDVRITPILASDLALLVLKVMETGLRGTYHVGGGECVSKYEFGRMVAEVFGFDPGLVRPASVGEARLRARRPKRLCLDGSKAEQALAVRLPGVREGLERMKEELDQGVREALTRLCCAETAAQERTE